MRIPVVLFLLVFCCCKSRYKNIQIVTADKEIAKGQVFKDSLFHGIVKYYDLSNNYLGYSTFKYGLEDGPAVTYKNGVVTDSLFYEHGLKSGIAYKFDDKGVLSYVSYFYHDRTVGHVFDYDEKGKVKQYSFFNFEGELIYKKQYVDTLIYETGSPINATINRRLVDGVETSCLFLYLLKPPDLHSHYELALLDSSRKIISTRKLSQSEFFCEVNLDAIPKNQSHAIVFHVFNKYKNRDDLIISEIK